MSGAAAAGASSVATGVRNYIRKSALWRPSAAAAERAAIQTQRAARWRIVTGDKVVVLSGRDAGKSGVVKSVQRRYNRVLVEGLNLVRKHVRPTEGVAGGIISVEAPIAYSNVNLADPTTGRPTRISMRFTEEGDKVRVAVKSGAIVPYPEAKKRRAIMRPTEPGVRDTAAAAVKERTYTPAAHLVPYLSAATASAADGVLGNASLFRVRGVSDAARVPSVLRQDIRRKDRLRIQRRAASRSHDQLVAEYAARASTSGDVVSPAASQLA